MPRRRVLLATVLVLVLAGSATAATPKPPMPKAPKPDATAEQTEAFLRQLGDAQKWMGEELWKIHEKVDELPGVVAETKEAETASQEQIDKMRDEVKGLYVELSEVKQQIETLKGEIAGVNANVTSFRNSSGVFLALVLFMTFVSTVMTVLRR